MSTTSKKRSDGSSKNSCAEVAAAGKNPDTYEQRSAAADVNELGQQTEEIKFESSAVTAEPKKVDVTTKAQMDARIARKQEKSRHKKKMLEAKLRENTDKINKLKDFAKKQKTAL